MSKPDNVYAFEVSSVSFNELTGELSFTIKDEDGKDDILVQATYNKLTLELIEGDIADCEKKLSELSVLIRRNERWWNFREDYDLVEKRLNALKLMREELVNPINIPAEKMSDEFMDIMKGNK